MATVRSTRMRDSHLRLWALAAEIVVVASALYVLLVLVNGGSLQSIVTAGILGAVVAPPLAGFIADRLPADFHPFIGNVASMAVSTAAVVPALGLLPGFTS